MQNMIYNTLSFLNKRPTLKILIIANIIMWGYLLSENTGKELGKFLYYITH